MCRGPRAAVRGACERGSEGGLRGGLGRDPPEWPMDTPEAQFRSEVRGSLRGVGPTVSRKTVADFRRSGRGPEGVRNGSGRGPEGALSWRSFWSHSGGDFEVISAVILRALKHHIREHC